MIRKIILFLVILFLNNNCSFDTKSGIWTNDEKIKKISAKNNKVRVLFEKEEIKKSEFNQNFLIKTPLKVNLKENTSDNNSGLQFINENFKKKSKYRFSEIKYFDNFSPELIFNKKHLIFFDKKGSVIKFDDTSKIIWKKNFYTKKEKKLLPILNFSSNDKIIIVTDNIGKYYALNINNGELLWSKNHNAILNSEIKIDGDRFYVADTENDLICFSLIDGNEIWKFQTDYSLIKSQKKLSIVFDDAKVYFNNSRGEIYSFSKNNGNLAWITSIVEDVETSKSFLLKTSKIVLDEDNLFVSNNKDTFFSIDKNTGLINWTQNISSELKPIIAENMIFSISSDGYLFIMEKISGNILRITDILKDIKSGKFKKNSMSGFVAGSSKIYLSMNNGKILQIDIKNGKLSTILNISRSKISRPFVNDGKMFIVKENSIIKLN